MAIHFCLLAWRVPWTEESGGLLSTGPQKVRHDWSNLAYMYTYARTLAPWKKRYDNPRQHIKKQRHYFAKKVPHSQNYGFLVVMYGCESWTIKKAECQRNDAFELWCWRSLLRVPWTARRSNKSILKEINPEYSLERLMLEAEVPMLWPPDAKSWLIRKDPDAGKDWRQEKKGTTEDEMVGWHHRLNGREFAQVLGDGEVQKTLVCCSPWNRK